ncbi:hypothetical protein ABVT39_022838 [Epinephelus coioides]
MTGRSTSEVGRCAAAVLFPEDTARRKQWEVALRREGFSASSSSAVSISSQRTLTEQYHSYVLPSSPDDLRARLSDALARVESLEREKRNAKDRERYLLGHFAFNAASTVKPQKQGSSGSDVALVNKVCIVFLGKCGELMRNGLLEQDKDGRQDSVVKHGGQNFMGYGALYSSKHSSRGVGPRLFQWQHDEKLLR